MRRCVRIRADLTGVRRHPWRGFRARRLGVRRGRLRCRVRQQGSSSPSWSRKDLPGSRRYRTVPVASPLICQVPARRSRACSAAPGCRGAVLMSAISGQSVLSAVDAPGRPVLHAGGPVCAIMPLAQHGRVQPRWVCGGRQIDSTGLPRGSRSISRRAERAVRQFPMRHSGCGRQPRDRSTGENYDHDALAGGLDTGSLEAGHRATQA